MAIKSNPEIETLADELAASRGQTAEEVVACALRAELAREPRRRAPARPVELAPGQRAKVERILQLVRAAGPVETDGIDPTADLYDDQGLPR